MGPSWLADILAAIMIVTAIYCVARIVISRTQHRQAENDVDGVHAAMGVAMAGMLVADLQLLPNGVWAVVFGLAGVWFAWRIARSYRPSGTWAATGIEDPLPVGRNHLVPHLVMCGAMVYMLLAVPAVEQGPSGGMSMAGSAGGGHFPALALVLSMFLFGYAVWETDRIQGLPRVGVQVLAGGGASAVPAVALPGGGAVGGAAGSAEVTTARTARTAQAAVAVPPGESAGVATANSKPVSPRLEGCCQVAMAVTMAYMLVLML